MLIREFDLTAPDGRRVHAYDGGGDGPVVFWHGGSPNTGLPPEPLAAAATALGVRWLGADRAGYGGSDPWPDGDRSPADTAADVRLVADAVGVGRFAQLSHSGGGPSALLTAARLGDRVAATAVISSPAPGDADGLDRYAGMAAGIADEVRAAFAGREALEARLATGEFDESAFTTDDLAALDGPWAWFDDVVRAATADGLAGFVADDLSMVSPWAAALSAVRTPVLIVHGDEDRMVPAAHGRWLAEAIPAADLRIVADAGHISVLSAAPAALAWLVARV